MKTSLIAVALLLLIACQQKPAATPTPSPDKYTMAQYLAIETGDTADEVWQILGDQGTLLSGEAVETGGMGIYQWENPDKSLIWVTFRNFRVERKVQVNLE